jgi:hypothetical protein
VAEVLGVAVVGDLVVHYARRYGREVLYVNHAGERRNPVASCELATGEVIIRDERFRGPAWVLLKEWVREHRDGRPPLVERIAGERVPDAVDASAAAPAYELAIPHLPPRTPEEDLANNLPGAGLRAMIRAQEAEHAAPVRWVAKLFGSELSSSEARRGLVGEQRVGAVLEPMKAGGWRVLHGVRWPSGADIDHVVIGPSGVFTVNTKHHPGASVWVRDRVFRVNGRSEDHLRFSETEQRRATKVLRRWCGWPVPVQAVVAVVGARRLDVAFTNPSVLVVDGERLDQELARLPAQLTRLQIESVFSVARHASIWR